jgi:hypothetical protein
MHRSEIEPSTQCADCGAEILAGAEPGYDFGENASLCSICARKRGGSYDSHQERWVQPPRVGDLLDEPR